MSFLDYINNEIHETADSFELEESTNSAAYKAGYRDGMRGKADRRASSKWGEQINDYQAGYNAGSQKAKDNKEKNAPKSLEMVRYTDFKEWEKAAKSTGGKINKYMGAMNKMVYDLSKDGMAIGQWKDDFGPGKGWLYK